MAPGQPRGKPELLAQVAELEPNAWKDALQIWEWAEPGYQETRSSALLAERLEQSGFLSLIHI